jgi:DNA-directed RNA polymerase specialized sigma24 family protein
LRRRGTGGGVTGRTTARARLEALLSPELLAALDDHVRELVDERLADQAAAGDGRDWYSLAEAARRLGCSYDAARLRAKRGRLETKRQGRTILVSARSLRLS